jgi:FixJ family two-component response regulator
MVYVVDDERALCRSLERLPHAMSRKVERFASAKAFLQEQRSGGAAGLILDIHMPGLSGLELQESLRDSSADIAIVSITGQPDTPAAVQAMWVGTVHFLPRPFSDGELLAAVEEGLELSHERRRRMREVEETLRRMAKLTPSGSRSCTWLCPAC